jgi:hypothetical protein
MTQDGTQSCHGSEGLWSVSPIIAILYCRTTGCTMFTRGFKAYPIYPSSQLLSNPAEDGLLDDLSHSAVLGAAGRQNSRLKSGIVIVGPSRRCGQLQMKARPSNCEFLAIIRRTRVSQSRGYYRAVPCGHESMSLVPRTLPPRANSTALSMSCRSFNLFDFYTPSKTVI